MIGDSARGQIDRGTWETLRDGETDTSTYWEDITGVWLRRESEGFIVAGKRLITVERRDPAGETFL